MSHQVTCPVCNGSGRRAVAPDSKWHTSTAGYDKDTHTLACLNCGGQTMACRGTGKVNARPDGSACVLEYPIRSMKNRKRRNSKMFLGFKEHKFKNWQFCSESELYIHIYELGDYNEDRQCLYTSEFRT